MSIAGVSIAGSIGVGYGYVRLRGRKMVPVTGPKTRRLEFGQWTELG